jgi:hypothetical protein
MNYATELARISVQPQNYSDENWDEAMILCDKADTDIAALNAKYEKLRDAYNDQIRIIEEQSGLIGGVEELVTSWAGIDGSHHKQWWRERGDEIDRLIRQRSALRGVVTKLKMKLYPDRYK